MRKLVSIEIGAVNRSSFTAVTSDNVPVIDQLLEPVAKTYNLGEMPVLKLTFRPGIAATRSDFISTRKIVRLVYDDASFSEWRVVMAKREFSGSEMPGYECEPIWADLGRRVIRQTLAATGTVRISIPFFNMTAAQALARILSQDLNCDPGFGLGSIESPYGDEIVSFTSNGMTHLEAVHEVCRQLDGGDGVEWEAVWNTGAGRYDIVVVKEIGGGPSQALLRGIEIGKSAGNRITLARIIDDDELFSAVVPIGGSDQELFGISPVVIAVVTERTISDVIATIPKSFAPTAFAQVLQGLMIEIDGVRRVVGPVTLTLARDFELRFPRDSETETWTDGSDPGKRQAKFHNIVGSPVLGTGTLASVNPNLTVLIGTGTSFTTQLDVGDIVFRNDFVPIGVVAAITDDNELELTARSGLVPSQQFRYLKAPVAVTEISYLRDYNAEADLGLVEKAYRRPDIGPYPNLVKAAGVSADLSDWNAGIGPGVITASTSTDEVTGTGTAFIDSVNTGDHLYTPTGVLIGIVDSISDDERLYLQDPAATTYTGSWLVAPDPIQVRGWIGIDGTEAIAPAWSEQYVRYGTAAARVSCDDIGFGIMTDEIELDSDAASPYYSIWTAIRVESGSVRIEVVDAAAQTHPPLTDKAITNVAETRSVSVGGFRPGAGPGRIRVVAEQAPTVFYIDAVTLTRSATAWEFLPLMGPQALLVEAATHLARYGGLRSPRYQGEVWDPKFVHPANYEITIGSYVWIRDLYDAATDSYGVDYTGRVTALTEYENRIAGRIRKTITVTVSDNRKLRTWLKYEFVPMVQLQQVPAILPVRNLQVT